jgi:hypothetical protein
MGDTGPKKRAVIKVQDPVRMKKKIHPDVLCINRKTGISVLAGFFLGAACYKG